MALTDLIPGFSQLKLIIAGAILAAVASFVAWALIQHHELLTAGQKITALNATISTLQSNATTLNENVASCVAANAAEDATVHSLLKERDAAQAAVKALSSQRALDSSTIDALKKTLAGLKDGPVAPVLAQTIAGIQQLEASK